MKPFSFLKDDLRMGQLTLLVSTPLADEDYRTEIYDMGPNFGDDEWAQLRGGRPLGWALYQDIQRVAKGPPRLSGKKANEDQSY